MKTPIHCKKYQLCDVNVLKLYYGDEGSPTLPPVVHATVAVTVAVEKEVDIECEFWNCRWLENAEAESNLKVKLSHLHPTQPRSC